MVPGAALHDELRNLVDAGISPCSALEAATKGVAEYLAVAEEFGRVAVGSRADLLLLEGNPVEDLAVLAQPVGVVVRGE